MITSTTNPRIKELVKLRGRRHRDRSGLFVIEGSRELARAVDADIAIDTVFVCPPLYDGAGEPASVATITDRGVEVLEVAPEPFAKAAYRDGSGGVVAVARQFPTDLDRLPLPPDPLLLVCEAIEKPGNLGTMLRTSAAASVAAVIVADPTTDPFNPNVVRASLGHLFTVPLAVATTESAIAWLRQQGVQIVALTTGGAEALHTVDLKGPTAVVVGSEQDGLSPAWIDHADTRAVIPMPGTADSLNAATAAAIALFEALRQRS